MKLILTKEIELRDIGINISIDLKNEKSTITLNYTCSDCGGHGCRRDSNCNNGTISMVLDPTKIDKNLDKDAADKLRTIIQKLSEDLTSNKFTYNPTMR